MGAKARRFRVGGVPGVVDSGDVRPGSGHGSGRVIGTVSTGRTLLSLGCEALGRSYVAVIVGVGAPRECDLLHSGSGLSRRQGRTARLDGCRFDRNLGPDSDGHQSFRRLWLESAVLAHLQVHGNGPGNVCSCLHSIRLSPCLAFRSARGAAQQSYRLLASLDYVLKAGAAHAVATSALWIVLSGEVCHLSQFRATILRLAVLGNCDWRLRRAAE